MVRDRPAFPYPSLPETSVPSPVSCVFPAWKCVRRFAGMVAGCHICVFPALVLVFPQGQLNSWVLACVLASQAPQSPGCLGRKRHFPWAQGPERRSGLLPRPGLAAFPVSRRRLRECSVCVHRGGPRWGLAPNVPSVCMTLLRVLPAASSFLESAVASHSLTA